MGMYTEFHFNAKLNKDVPQEVINVLRFMLGELETQPELPAHPLFQTERWSFMLKCDSNFFDADTLSTLRFDEFFSGRYYLCIRCNFKNYHDEINKFISWIMPYLDKLPGSFLGFSRYEETEQPTLIFMKARA